ncbi:hypothetical protein EMCRGX_G020545 [Ephydatia muelleri]
MFLRSCGNQGLGRDYKFFIVDRLPFIKWLRRYTPKCFISDLIAGLTVALMLVPQALAYATIAGLPLRYGLYSSFMGCFVYTFFGTSKDVSLGPTAILSLLTLTLIDGCGTPGDKESHAPCAVALTLFSGLVQLVCAVLNLGWLVDFIPVPVISGFTSAAAITVIIGQFKNLLGIDVYIRHDLYLAIYDLFKNIGRTHPWDLLFGLLSIGMLVFLKLFKTHNLKLEQSLEPLYWAQKVAFKFLWLLCTAHNAVVVIFAALIGASIKSQFLDAKELPLTFVQYREDKALPELAAPQINATIVQASASSSIYCHMMSHNDIGWGILVAPFIGFIESIAIAKFFAQQHNYVINPTQELLALGTCVMMDGGDDVVWRWFVVVVVVGDGWMKIAVSDFLHSVQHASGLSNVLSSFFGSFPIAGSFARTSVNAQSGVRTPAGGIVTGAVVLLAIALLNPWFDNIPQPVLGALVIVAVAPLIDVKMVWTIWKVKGIDDLSLLLSFLLTLFLGITWGVPVTCLFCIALLLYRHAKPRHKFTNFRERIIVTFNGGWTYPGAEYVWQRIEENVFADQQKEPVKNVVLDCADMPEIDFTVVQILKDHCDKLERKGINISVVGAQPQDQKKLTKLHFESASHLDFVDVFNTNLLYFDFCIS